MKKEKMDIAKVLAMLAQPRETPPPLEHVERRTLDIPYITKEEKVDLRKVRIFIPENVSKPMPLVYIPHYEMGEDAAELRAYLAEGWAVACPTEAPPDANAKLTGDNLVFNNAALYMLRQMDDFDNKRIAVVGGSAGGYMALMLTGQNLGICATVANGPVANVRFNFTHYFRMAQAMNMQALAQIAAEKNGAAAPNQEAETEENAQLALLKSLAGLPIPFIAALAGQFDSVDSNFPDAEDTAAWEAITGVGVANRFSNPVMVNHSTSDVLVPVDQITRRYTYKKPGASLPEDFDALLPQSFPGKLGKTLEECLPADETRTLRIPVPEVAGESDLPYDSEKRFNINIFDDGPIEGYGTHSSRMDVGRRFDLPYLRKMFEKTSTKTNILAPAMLKFLLEQYEGKSLALPAHAGIDDNAYGSLAVYKKKVCRELAEWVAANSEAGLRKIFDVVLAQETDEESKDSLSMSMSEIVGQMG